MQQRKVLGLLALALCGCSGRERPIDQVYNYSADLTHDGSNEKIVLAIHGAGINKPFKWSLSVTDTSGRILYGVEKDDSWIDKAYGETGYMPGCSDYEQCKRRYYFEEKPKDLSDCLKGGETNKLAASSNASVGYDNSSEAARNFLQARKTPPAAIEAALKELQSALASPRTLSLCYREHKQDHGQYLIWLKAVGSFVPYYAP